MSVFVNMDGIMGNHFEIGLRNLKAAAEPQVTKPKRNHPAAHPMP
jgi:hypothetical protein